MRAGPDLLVEPGDCDVLPLLGATLLHSTLLECMRGHSIVYVRNLTSALSRASPGTIADDFEIVAPTHWECKYRAAAELVVHTNHHMEFEVWRLTLADSRYLDCISASHTARVG